MVKTFNVRYGRNYKVALAIVLPCLLIAPLIMIMAQFPDLEEWKVWVLIYSFLGGIIALSLWLVFKVYPKTELTIRKNEISLSFDHNNLFSTADFSFQVTDITSFNRGVIGNAEYFIIETSNPRRKFQISAISADVEDLLLFNEAMVEISEMVIKQNEL